MLKAVLQKLTSFRVCHLITIIMVMTLYNVIVDGALTRRPADTTAMVGDEVVLKCSTDLDEPLYWARRLHGSDDIDVIFQADTLVERHIGKLKVTKNEVGAFDLHILNATLAVAGNYYCVDDDNAYKPDGQDKQHIELAIVDSILNCTHNIDQAGRPMLAERLCGYDFTADRVNISCNVRYRGRNAPSITLTHHLFNGTKVEPDVGVTQSSADGLVVKNASLCVKDSFRGSHFVAAVSLNSIKQWSSPSIEVLYIEENLQSGNATIVSIPTFEICTWGNNLNSLGRDVIHFNWINNKTGFIEDSNQLMIMEYHTNLVGEYTCMMHFNFRGKRKHEVIRTVIVENQRNSHHVTKETDASNDVLKVILFIQIVQIAVILAYVYYKCRPKCKRAQSKETRTSDGMNQSREKQTFIRNATNDHC